MCAVKISKTKNKSVDYKMYKILKISILLQILTQTLAKENEDIAALEKEKTDLFNQINKAIDESVILLQKSNDSEAIQGVDYMTKLKNQLNDINNTEYKELGLFNDSRRSVLADRGKYSLFDIASVYKKAENKKREDKKNLNEKKIREQIEDWLKEREIEKLKILAYKSRNNYKGEKCKRFGLGKAKNRHEGNKRNKTDKTKPKYPCCRKCCKKSYMGCL